MDVVIIIDGWYKWKTDAMRYRDSLRSFLLKRQVIKLSLLGRNW